MSCEIKTDVFEFTVIFDSTWLNRRCYCQGIMPGLGSHHIPMSMQMKCRERKFINDWNHAPIYCYLQVRESFTIQKTKEYNCQPCVSSRGAQQHSKEPELSGRLLREVALTDCVPSSQGSLRSECTGAVTPPPPPALQKDPQATPRSARLSSKLELKLWLVK